ADRHQLLGPAAVSAGGVVGRHHRHRDRPLMLRVESMLWGRRGLAVAVMTLLMLLGFIVPLTLALLTIVTHAHDIVDWVESLATSAMSLPPHWLAHVPIAGSQLAEKWSDAAAVPPAEIAA